MSEKPKPMEKQKPTYYEFMKGLLTQKRLNAETVEGILRQYIDDPNGFEADFGQMHRYLRFMGLRAADADYVALAFHSQIVGRPEYEIARTYGIATPSSMGAPYGGGRPYPHQGNNPNAPQYPTPQKNDDSLDIKGLMKLKQEMKIMDEIFKEDEPLKSPVPAPNPMQDMLPWMMMMNPNMNVQAKMGKNAEGQDVIQGFTIIPGRAQAQGGSLVENVLGRALDKSDKVEEILLSNLMGNKDEKIQKLEQKIAQVSEVRGSDYMLDELKRFQEFQKMFNPQALSGGDPQIAMELQSRGMKHDLEMAEFNARQAEQTLRNQITLREYVDTRKEKAAQMRLSEKALGALSENVGKIVHDIGAPLATATAEGIKDTTKQGPSPSPASASAAGPNPRIQDLSNEELQAARQKAANMKAEALAVQARMDQYADEFKAEEQRRAYSPARQVTEPVPLTDEVDDTTGEGQRVVIDLDPASLTYTE